MTTSTTSNIIFLSRKISMALPCTSSTLEYLLELDNVGELSNREKLNITHKHFNEIYVKCNSGYIYFVSLSLNSNIKIYIGDIIEKLNQPTTCGPSIAGELSTYVAGYQFGKNDSQNIDFVYDSASSEILSISIVKTCTTPNDRSLLAASKISIT